MRAASTAEAATAPAQDQLSAAIGAAAGTAMERIKDSF
jgi:hypothetical protein